MPERKLIKTEALIVGCAMARLGPPFLAQVGWRSWLRAHEHRRRGLWLTGTSRAPL